MSNIVDELLLLTEWYFINRMAYYISQGRVEAPIRIDGQLCYSSVANLLQHLYAKNYQNTMQLDKFIAKNKKVQFFCPTVYYGQAELQREGGTTCTLRYGTVHYVVSH